MTAPSHPHQGNVGTPSPNRWITHETIKGNSKVIDGSPGLYEGAAVTSGVACSCVVTCAGASRARVRIKASCAGELKLEFIRPRKVEYAVEPYAVGNPAPVPIEAGTETLLSTDEIAGEAQARISFTPSANGTITMLDWMAL